MDFQVSIFVQALSDPNFGKLSASADQWCPMDVVSFALCDYISGSQVGVL